MMATPRCVRSVVHRGGMGALRLPARFGTQVLPASAAHSVPRQSLIQKQQQQQRRSSFTALVAATATKAHSGSVSRKDAKSSYVTLAMDVPRPPSEDPHAVLGLPPTASREDIERVHQQLVMHLLPEYEHDPTEAEVAQAKLGQVSWAYSALVGSLAGAIM